MQQQRFMKHFRNMLFVLGVFSIVALLPELASAQQFHKAAPGTNRSGDLYGNNLSFNPATANWKDGATAIQLVTQRLSQMESVLTTLSPGTPAYFQADIRRAYYKLLLNSLEAGAVVKDAVMQTGKTVSRDYPTATAPTLNAIVTEAAGLLTN